MFHTDLHIIRDLILQKNPPHTLLLVLLLWLYYYYYWAILLFLLSHLLYDTPLIKIQTLKASEYQRQLQFII